MATDSHGMGIELPADSTPIHQFPGVTRLAMERVAELLAGDITPGVAAAIAEQVGPAVDAELAQAGVVSGLGSTNADDVALSMTDTTGRRSWMEIAKNGGPTQFSAKLIDAALAGYLAARISTQTALLPLPQTISEGAGLAYVLTDAGGRMSELQLDLAGKLTGPFPARIIAAAVAEASKVGIAQVPISCWGDSLTEGGWPATMAAQLSTTVRNLGVGGQGVESIAARQGSIPAKLTFPSDTIPANGAVTVTSSAIPYSSGSAAGTSSGHGTIAGVAGVLSRDNTTGVHTFTRDTAGAAVWAPPGTVWTPDTNEVNRGQITVFWVGRNSFLTRTAAELAAQVRTMAKHLASARPRFLVLEIPPAVGEETQPAPTANRVKLDAANAALAAEFPNEFVPIAQYLRGPALADGGINPTAQDNTDIANGLTPSSLRGDTLHPNAAAHVLIGKYVAKVITQKGWLTA